MRKLLLVTILCLMLSACANEAVPDPFAGDFACEVAFLRGGTDYTVRYARLAGEETATVVAPATLAGLTAVRRDGEITLTHADVTFTALAADGIFDFAALLAPVSALQRSDDGRCTAADGRTLYTDGAGVPTRVLSDTFDLRILRFQGGNTQ